MESGIKLQQFCVNEALIYFLQANDSFSNLFINKWYINVVLQKADDHFVAQHSSCL